MMPSKQLSPAQKLLILLLLVLVSSLLSLAMGDRELNLADLGAYFQGQATSQSFILQEIRLPRLLVSLLAGGSLGLSGVLLQTFTRNPLADSSTLGINAGVGLVLTLAVTQLNLTDPFLIHYLPFLAIPGGLAMVALSFFLSHKKGEGIQPVKLIIAGVTLSTILTSSLIAITGRVDTHKLNYVVSWLAGHTTGSNWDSLNLASPVLILLWILSYTQALPLNLLQLSDPAALGPGAAPPAPTCHCLAPSQRPDCLQSDPSWQYQPGWPPSQPHDPAALPIRPPLAPPRRPLDWRPPTPHRRHPHPHLPNRQQHPHRHSPHPHR